MSTGEQTELDVLFGTTRRGVLGLLFSRPTERFHLRQIGRLTGAGIGALQREMEALTKAGLARRQREGVHVYYHANEASPVFEEMKGLVLKTVGIGEMLRAALEPLQSEILAAYLFGSVARGQQREGSDVDVLVVSNTLTLRRVVEALRAVESRIGREINPVVYRLAEFKSKLAGKSAFVTRVMSERKVLLLGDEHVLG